MKKIDKRKALESKVVKAVNASRYTNKRGNINYTAAGKASGLSAKQIKKFYKQIEGGGISSKDKDVEAALSRKPSYKAKSEFARRAIDGVYKRTKSKKHTAKALGVSVKSAGQLISGQGLKSEKIIDKILDGLQEPLQFFSGKAKPKKTKEKKSKNLINRYYDVQPGTAAPRVRKKAKYQVIGTGSYKNRKKPITTNLWSSPDEAMSQFTSFIADYDGLEIDTITLRVITIKQKRNRKTKKSKSKPKTLKKQSKTNR